ncbi:MAG: 50S ribosomal protein L32 [Actinobacteria bacterium]|nr:50S ribosomal protein L32 [Actinomycetota bacterium]
MAVPKRRTSKARRDSRRATWRAISGPSLVECPQCHDVKLTHRVCKTCGYYNRTQVLEVE